MTSERTHQRLLSLIALLAVAGPLAACGGGEAAKKGPPGSKSNPLVATIEEDGDAASPGRTNESAPATGGDKAKPGSPNYNALLEQQTSKPASRFSPCSLVTANEAGAILGKKVMPPVEAPQGPTCVYRTRSGDLMALAMQIVPPKTLRGQLRGSETLTVAGRRAFCAKRGQPSVLVPLSGGRVLTVSGDCSVAKRFAADAVGRLTD